MNWKAILRNTLALAAYVTACLLWPPLLALSLVLVAIALVVGDEE